MQRNPHKLPVITVIPYLNEQDTLLQTCLSLGFGKHHAALSEDTLLILVDNGSTDNTLQTAERIQNMSPPGCVFLEYESERGYVPPRHKGNLRATEICKQKNWKQSEVVILQADADTRYAGGYITAMHDASVSAGIGTLIHGYSEYPPDFIISYRDFVNLCNRIDEMFAKVIVEREDDYIIDDKVCGYRLSDYFTWGGHIREYNGYGDEIHGETIRLFLRGIAKGAHVYRVEEANAFHSMRKVLKQPSLEFATAGFPRDERWKQWWLQTYGDSGSIIQFQSEELNSLISPATAMRLRHNIALFILLPIHISLTTNRPLGHLLYNVMHHFDFDLPSRTPIQLIEHPGSFIEDIFTLSDRMSDELVNDIKDFLK